MNELKKIHQMWAVDAVIQNDLDAATKATATNHAKYLQLRAEAKLMLQRQEHASKKLMRDKFLYYTGKLSRDQIDALGWNYDPFDGLKIMKSDMDKYYDADTDIQKALESVAYWKTIVETLNEIIEVLKWRHQSVSNIIKWKIFEAGG